MQLMYEIEYSFEALDDLYFFRKNEQQEVMDEIDTQLRHEPLVETRNRKQLRPNAVASWELRIGRFRVFYNVDEEMRYVSIEAIGFKIGNELFIRGERIEL